MKKYDDMPFLEALNNKFRPMTTHEVKEGVMLSDPERFKLIHWRTVQRKLENMHKEGLIEYFKASRNYFWKIKQATALSL